MGDVAKAIIATNDMSLIIITMFVLVGIVGILTTIIGMQYRRRVKSQDKIVRDLAETQRINHEKEEIVTQKVDNVRTSHELLAKAYDRDSEVNARRLQAGAERMENIGKQIDQIRENGIRELSTMVQEIKFDKYCDEHREEHAQINKHLEDLQKVQNEVMIEVRSMNASLDGRLSAMASLIAKGFNIKTEG